MAAKEFPPAAAKEAEGSMEARPRVEAMRWRTAEGRVSGEAHRVAAWGGSGGWGVTLKLGD
jgi:hypothetical protein